MKSKGNLFINQFNNTCGYDQKKQFHASGGNKLIGFERRKDKKFN